MPTYGELFQFFLVVIAVATFVWTVAMDIKKK